MNYTIKSTQTNGINLSEDSSSINIDVTIIYNLEGESKLQDSSVGTTINLSLSEGERSTMVAELQTKTTEWFNTNYNPIT